MSNLNDNFQILWKIKRHLLMNHHCYLQATFNFPFETMIWIPNMQLYDQKSNIFI